ncbi:hypothetical protein SNOG_10256 [Parastagonospora nodorum SN15]|uniref:Uncharacterized protein n=1 Tax=Phaeosphaeria nodorum (strain SN15 / ATCC MYA-4574 / FGSC 10173) TaxID=321614 RepID=Q0UDA8_PHANO|nr:hypothetical protein SNOG_10256 [Parastagonospora nodorum SN15]EAT82591.1 hypothetical protein SNOG_10256 [Parastagonospora nodorum SN15]
MLRRGEGQRAWPGSEMVCVGRGVKNASDHKGQWRPKGAPLAHGSTDLRVPTHNDDLIVLCVTTPIYGRFRGRHSRLHYDEPTTVAGFPRVLTQCAHGMLNRIIAMSFWPPSSMAAS